MTSIWFDYIFRLPYKKPMTVLRKHHSSSYNNPINMKFVQLALVLLATIVLALAAPPDRPNKPFRPNPRIHSRADETTTFRTYQPKYNPFKSTVLRTSTSSPILAIGTKAKMPTRSEVRFRNSNLLKKLSTDPTSISVPVDEPVVFSTTDATFPWPTEPELPPVFPELESLSPSPSSEDPSSLFSESIPSSPIPPAPFSPSHVTSKPPTSTTSEYSYSTVSSSELTSNSITNRPVLLRPLPSTLLKPQSEIKSSSVSSIRPFSSFESISSSTPKSLFSALPRPNTLDPSSRVPKALVSPSSPSRSPSVAKQNLTSSVSQSSPASTALRNAKSLNSPPAYSLSKDDRAPIIPVSLTNSEPKPKTPVSSVSAASIVPLSLRSSKSVSLPMGSNGYTKGEPKSYSFAYKVNDPSTKQDFGHSEKRVGNNTKGRYDVLLPDGRRQVVDYQILDDRGYVADVTYQNS